MEKNRLEEVACKHSVFHAKFSSNSFRARLSIIYCPPYSDLHPVSLKRFLMTLLHTWRSSF